MYNHNKAQQSKNRVHISWDILYDNFDYRYRDVYVAPMRLEYRTNFEIN